VRSLASGNVFSEKSRFIVRPLQVSGRCDALVGEGERMCKRIDVSCEANIEVPEPRIIQQFADEIRAHGIEGDTLLDEGVSRFEKAIVTSDNPILRAECSCYRFERPGLSRARWTCNEDTVVA
jgi:hypothetical protein